MEIEKLQVKVRPRASWEAVDLGIAMLRTWWVPVYLPWLCLLCPVWVLSQLLCRGAASWLPILLLWWLKPLWDRIPLFVLSRTMFGQNPTTRQALRALFATKGGSLFLSLTLYRFSPIRAIQLAVLMLEGLEGRRLSKRQNAFSRGLAGFGTTIAILFFLIEWLALFGSCWALLYLVMPLEGETALLEIPASLNPWLSSGFYLIAMTVTEPLFVAVGFALYLNRRTVTEGWDLELAFRRLARKITRSEALRVSLLLLFGWLSFSAGPLGATTWDREQAKSEIEDVLSDPVFGTKETVKTWRPRNNWLEKLFERSEKKETSNLNFGPALGQLLRFVLIAIAAILLFLAVRALRPPRIELRRAEAKGEPVPIPDAMGVVLDLAELPDDIVTQAQIHWRAGGHRAALSLLFRGAIRVLTEQNQLKIQDFATEEECLRKVRRKASKELSGYFTQLVRDWQKTAYGHRPPSNERFDDLCSQWQLHLRVAPVEATP